LGKEPGGAMGRVHGALSYGNESGFVCTVSYRKPAKTQRM
jgi:hypothetical protein